MKKVGMIILGIILLCPVKIYAQVSDFDGIVIDKTGGSNGQLPTTPTWGLKFGGSGSGEGILSTRHTAANIQGLDFFTNRLQRLRILNNGNIGIGSYATPTTKLSFGPYTPGTDLPLRLAIFDNGLRFGLGYFEAAPGLQRIFSFHVSEPVNSRFGFFDNYSSTGVNGYEFVTFKAGNRSVGICNTTPTAKLHVVTSESNEAQPTFAFDFNSGGASYPRLSLYQNFSMNPRNHIDATLYTVASNTTTAAPLYLQTMYGGNVGIGYFGLPSNTTTYDFQPQSKLHIQQGALQITNSGDAATQTTGKMGLLMGHSGIKNSTSTNSYSWIQSSKGPLLLNPLSGNSLTGVQTNNYVAIGFLPSSTELASLPPMGYNLLVQGKVMCEELKIKLKKDGNGNTVWYDHVFLPTYKLMSLDSLENYIVQNNHLPEIPTEADVQEHGIMAGEMNGLLLKKIEELTLYMIEQNKNITNQNTQNQVQTKALSDQAEQIQLLKEQNELLKQQLILMQKK